MNGNLNNKIQFKHRLLSRLLISYILLASIPIIITGLVLVHTARKSIEKTVIHRNLEFAKRAARNITMTLDDAQRILKFNAQNVLNLPLSRLASEVLINNIVREFNIFKEIYILNPDGSIEISTHYVEDKFKLTGQGFVEKVNSGESFFSEIFISEDKLPYMEFAEPIAIYGETVAILFARVNLRVMWDVVDSSVVGLNAQALVFDKHGTYIAHSQRKKVYLKESFPDSVIIDEIIHEHSGSKILKSADGEKIIAAYTPISITKWGIVIQQPVREAFAQVHKMRIQIFIFVITAILIASIIALIYSRRIVSPVNQLISGIQKFATGDLKYRIPPLGKDEISTLAEQFNAMAIRLDEFQTRLKRTERLETMSKMAAILSHEIRNPLNAMIINLQLQKKEFSRKSINRKKLEYYYNIVVSEITRVDKLVGNFLLLARPPRLKKKAVILQEILQEIIEEQAGNTWQHNITLKTAIQQAPISLFADKNRLKQAFLNIYLNAVQAMKDGGKLTISAFVELVKDEYYQKKIVKLIFKDTGPGISREDREHIFDFYYTTKKGGTGLGLAIAQQIIEDHEGQIEVESTPGKGASFIVTLPANYST